MLSTEILLATPPSVLNPFVWMLNPRLQRSFSICCKRSPGCWPKKALRIQLSSSAFVVGWCNMSCFAEGGEHDICWWSFVWVDTCWPLALHDCLWKKCNAWGSSSPNLRGFKFSSKRMRKRILRSCWATWNLCSMPILRRGWLKHWGLGQGGFPQGSLSPKSSCHQFFFYGDDTYDTW